MAQRTFTGVVSGDYGVAGNWLEGSVPVAGDEVTIDGSVDITAGLDQSAVAVDSFSVNKTRTGALATSVSKLKINCTGPVILKGTGNYYLDLASNDPTSIVVEHEGAGATGVHLTVGTGATEAPLVLFRKGYAYMDAGNVTDMLVAYLTDKLNDAHVELIAGTWDLVRQVGGYLKQLGGDIAFHRAVDGTAEIKEGDYQKLDISGGAKVYYDTKATSGTLDDVTSYGGVFDATRDLRPKTIAAARSYGEGTLLLDNPFLTLTTDVLKLGQKDPNYGFNVVVSKV